MPSAMEAPSTISVSSPYQVGSAGDAAASRRGVFFPGLFSTSGSFVSSAASAAPAKSAAKASAAMQRQARARCTMLRTSRGVTALSAPRYSKRGSRRWHHNCSPAAHGYLEHALSRFSTPGALATSRRAGRVCRCCTARVYGARTGRNRLRPRGRVRRSPAAPHRTLSEHVLSRRARLSGGRALVLPQRAPLGGVSRRAARAAGLPRAARAGALFGVWARARRAAPYRGAPRLRTPSRAAPYRGAPRRPTAFGKAPAGRTSCRTAAPRGTAPGRRASRRSAPSR